MQSAWSDRVRGTVRPPRGVWVTACLVLLLTLALANSTVTANWVPDSSSLTLVALGAGLLFGLAALIRPLPAGVALLVGLLAAPLVAVWASHGALVHAHPSDPGDLLGLARAWWPRVLSGDAALDNVSYLYLLNLGFWLIGGWLAWCSLRWRQPLLGVAPGAVVFAGNLLNFPDQQNGYVLSFLILTLSLLLWSTYQRSLESAGRRQVRLSGDARWDFWESGVLVLVGLVLLGLFLPPLSTTDRTIDLQNSAFRGWADLQERLNHPVPLGAGAATGNSIGFTSDVRMGGPIQRTSGVVFTYKFDNANGGPAYFRGLNLSRTGRGPTGPEWKYNEIVQPSVPIAKDTAISYAESYQEQAQAGVRIQMLKPPGAAQDVIFYTGQLQKLDRAAVAHSSRGYGQPIPSRGLYTLDRLSGLDGQGGSGSYHVNTTYSTAGEDQLRAAGTDYPAWLEPYRAFSNAYQPSQAATLPTQGYRRPEVLQRIAQLAQQVTAGKTNPYDQAQAIEAYLRSTYTYTLSPPSPGPDDPLDYFLFTGKQGYCEYFASAMGDMLRSLGLPTRLVNGYGPGTYDEKLDRFVVKESDAHTWVEVYFPSYGWIPFEPTPDGQYFPIQRAGAGAGCAPGSIACDPNAVGAGNGGLGSTPRIAPGLLDPNLNGVAGTGGAGASRLPAASPLLLLLLALFLALGLLFLSRYLRPGTADGAWSRTRRLAALAGIRGSPGETPLEFGRRLAREMPEAAGPAGRLADRFTLAAYAPRQLAEAAEDAALEAWLELRPLLLRRLKDRLTRRRVAYSA
ncbi:MAG: transglutaminase domain-containing protein [Candidatus Dormibacteraeota bacterium]|uniref:Transglutaminase domain-containing protein n=1 Tax=Candidatus Dormiibacter inghamiae TaxID=3127013 RepID=A0A934NCP1_9BACT|nr:transglutaminase domain-containing protein [Candidatus Dormibacteraeota bacterium]MBJ7607281.1 transglutaminase domain-containing protein [Candidatus Dormibacteraeota bacterium]